MGMECAVCWGDLQEEPANESGQSQPKKAKIDSKKKKDADVCCTPCGHLFHKSCLLKWFKQGNSNQSKSLFNICTGSRSGTCPNCRRNVKEKDLYPAFFSSNNQGSNVQLQNPSAATLINDKQKHLSTKSLSSSDFLSNSGKSNEKMQSKISCGRQECIDLNIRFEILRKEYDDLSEKFRAERERADFNEAVNKSLLETNPETNLNKKGSNTKLKEQGQGKHSEDAFSSEEDDDDFFSD